MVCPVCGEKMEGDGYTVVIHCPNASPEVLEAVEPDANPVFCE